MVGRMSVDMALNATKLPSEVFGRCEFAETLTGAAFIDAVCAGFMGCCSGSLLNLPSEPNGLLPSSEEFFNLLSKPCVLLKLHVVPAYCR